MRKRLNDTTRLILAAIAVTLVLAFIIFISVLIPDHYTERIQGKWVRFGIVSICLLAYAAKAYWKLRRSWNFWAIFLGFLVIHVFGIGRFFYLGNGLPLLVFGPLCGVELCCMALIVYWFLGVGPDKVNLNV